MTRLRTILLLAIAAAPALAGAAQSVALPAWVCTHPDAIFIGGFESGESVVPHDPSAGSGGAAPGSLTRTVHVVGLNGGSQLYYIYVPSNYTPKHAWPLIMVLHGVAPYGGDSGNQYTYASAVRDNWVTAATSGQFLVAAPVANDIVTVSGVQAVTWLVPPTTGPNDYDMFAAIRADMEAAYNIEQTRVYVWGFSAGGGVAEDLAVNTYSTAFNASTMAAIGASSADLDLLACAGLTSTQCGEALAALPRKIPIDIHIGMSDSNYSDAQSDHSLLLSQGWIDGQTLYYTAFIGGHNYSVAQLGTIWGNLCPNAVTP